MPLRTFISAFLVVGVSISCVGAEERTIVVREQTISEPLSGQFTFKVVRIEGYSITIRVSGKNRVLKVGEAFSTPSADCTVVFEEIAVETRVARFKTTCP